VPRQKVMEIMQKVRISDSKTVGKVMAAWGFWKEGNSSVVNSHKALIYHSELGKVEKCKGFWRVKGCESEWKEHAQLLTELLAGILIEYPQSIIYREHFIKEVGLRPDAIILNIHEGKGRCIIYEVMLNETEEYFRQKENAWKQWPQAKEYLSNLFGYKIKSFTVKGIRNEH